MSVALIYCSKISASTDATILNTDIFSWIKLEISRSIIASRKFLSACGSIMYLNVVLSVVTCSEIKLDISRLILLLSFFL